MADERHTAKTTYGIAFGSDMGSPAEQWNQSHASFANSDNDRRQHTSGTPTEAINCTPQISNLCATFVKGNAKGKETVKIGCFGFVPYKENRFDLSHESCNPAGSTVITLKQMLSDNHSQSPRLDLSQKIKIAYMLSSNLLPLVTTPWLEKVLNLDQIAFLGVEKGADGVVYQLDRPYLAKNLLASPKTLSLSCGHLSPPLSAKHNPVTILSLACLLVQIILGRSMDEFDTADQSCLDCLMRRRAAASQKVGAVLEKGVNEYADAVKWCLKNFLCVTNLDDGEFTHQYYSNVVAELEKLVSFAEHCS